MARIIARLHGKELANLLLEDGREYLIGRGEDCAIVLPAQKGLSRQHIKLYQRDNVWVVELLSRFGTLKSEGKEAQTLEMEHDTVFLAVPFEFSFTLNEPEAIKEPTNPSVPSIRQTSVVIQREFPEGTIGSSGNNEATIAGRNSVLTAFIRVIKKDKEEVLKLEGHLWVGGRDDASEIPLRENRASRRHFEMLRTPEGFFITDLGSANGTLLNDEPLPANEQYQLASGDVIKIGNTKIVLEIRDLNFASNLPALAPMASNVGGGLPMPMPYGGDGAGNGNFPAQFTPPDAFQPWSGGEAKQQKPNRIRLILMVMVPILLYGFLQKSEDADKAATTKKTENSSQAPTFEQLSKEQQQSIKDSFQLAKNHYLSRNYELCAAEVNKLHQVVPAYENSREIDAWCRNGQEQMLRKDELDRLEKKRAETEQAILQTVDECRRKTNASEDEIKICLADAIERNPDHPMVMELIDRARSRDEAKVRQRNQMASRSRQKAMGQKAFERARDLYKSGNYLKAIAEYERFLTSTFPDVEQEKSQAKRDLAQVRKELSDKVGLYLRVCKENIEKQLYRDAVVQCQLALKEQPNNQEVRQLISKAETASDKELKGIYEDSVLEESMGNIDGAKERWKQILSKAIPGRTYYQRALKNLRKYEVTD